MADSKIRILVIDDHVDLTNMVRDVLEAQGYEVLTANSGERGLELAFTEHPHLILLDVMMPGMDGYQVCRELQFGYTKDIPVVFLTAKTQLASMMEASRSGASAFIAKPFRVEHLVQTVRDVLRDASVHYDEITGLPTLANVQVEIQRQLFDRTAARPVLHQPRRRLRPGADPGLRGLRRGLPHRGPEARGVEGQPPARGGVRRHLEPRERLPGRPLGAAPAAGRERGEPAPHQGAARGEPRRSSSRLRSSRSCWRRSRLYVGFSTLSQSPKVRFKRALLQSIENAMQAIQYERSASHTLLVDELDRVLADEQISCVYQPIVDLEDYTVIGYEVLARGPQSSELHAPEMLFEVARDQGRVQELDLLCRLMASRSSSSLPDSAAALHQHGAGEPLHARQERPLRRGVRRGHPRAVARQDGHRDHREERHRGFRAVPRRRLAPPAARLPHRHRRRRGGLLGAAHGGRGGARLHQARHQPDPRRRTTRTSSRSWSRRCATSPARPASPSSPRASRPRRSSRPCASSRSPTDRASSSATPVRRIPCRRGSSRDTACACRSASRLLSRQATEAQPVILEQETAAVPLVRPERDASRRGRLCSLAGRGMLRATVMAVDDTSALHGGRFASGRRWLWRA